MSKYALEAMADAQRLELGESSGIRVCLARLGNIATPIFEKNKVRMTASISLSSLSLLFFLSSSFSSFFFLFFFLKIADMKDMKNLNIYQNHLDILPGVTDAITKNAADPIKVAKVTELNI